MRRLVTIMLCLALGGTASAASLEGVEMADTLRVADKELTLNGLGLRRASAFNVKVYVIGLYLEEPSRDAPEIIASEQAKRVVMHLLRDVDAKELRKAWREAFRKNCDDLESLAPRIDRLLAAFADVKKGKRLEIDLPGDRVDVRYDGKTLVSIEGKDFQRAVLSTWIGPKPPNRDLKAGLLRAGTAR